MTTGRILIDADACPVKAEAERVATRLGMRMVLVSNGGIRPSANPLVESVFVAAGPDEADKWIADTCWPGRCGGDLGHPAGREMRGQGRASGEA